jgi:hypothetical protein
MVMHDAHDKRHSALLIPTVHLHEIGIAEEDEKKQQQ